MLYISCGLQHSRIKVGFLIFRSMLRICRYWVRTRSRSAVCQITSNKSSYSRFHFAATRTKHMSLRAENRIHAAVTGYPLSPNLGTGTTCVWGPGMDSCCSQRWPICENWRQNLCVRHFLLWLHTKQTNRCTSEEMNTLQVSRTHFLQYW